MRSRLARLRRFRPLLAHRRTRCDATSAAKPGGGGTGTCPRSNFCVCAQIYLSRDLHQQLPLFQCLRRQLRGGDGMRSGRALRVRLLGAI